MTYCVNLLVHIVRNREIISAVIFCEITTFDNKHREISNVPKMFTGEGSIYSNRRVNIPGKLISYVSN